MSGIVGIVQQDGAPVDRKLLRGMTEFMAFRGPDAQEIWVEGAVGFGHAMLRTTFEQAREQQPCTLDGQVWITADGRIDGRSELRQKLAARGRTGCQDATDVDLILHAYAAWGEACVEHLLGDFAFAIWDGRERKLFCARDHFGVKPFYYVQDSAQFLLSNTLNCLRRHPAVSAELNELAIADFLLFGYNQEADTTTFVAIRRLPPAHTLTWQDGAVRVQRYWTLPIEETLCYKRPEEYVERFRELFWQAVDDRLRTDSVGVFMSGGLDSTAVAAAAKNLLTRQQLTHDLHAYTVVYDQLIPDQERYWSGLAAKHIGIPIHYLVVDEYEPWQGWDCPEQAWPEPANTPFGAITVDLYRKITAQHRVVLSGYGGDPALYPSQAYFVDQVRRLRFDRIIHDAGRYFLAHRRLLPLYFGTWLRKRSRPAADTQALPAWLNLAFADRLELAKRDVFDSNHSMRKHPARGEAYASLISLFWTSLFEDHGPGVTQVTLEERHPFFDLRLLRFLLRMPPAPWFVHKELLRQSMHGYLPEAVCSRPKTPLKGDPFLLYLAGNQSGNRRISSALYTCNDFLDCPTLAKLLARPKELDPLNYDITRPISLMIFLTVQTNSKLISKENTHVTPTPS
jgi:asparagine synthase (glutamine-hydrolysing)